MIRKLTLAAMVASVTAFPALAQSTKPIDPSTEGPTGAITREVPTMKVEPGSTVPSKSTGAGTTPSMKPAATVTGAVSSTTGLTLSDAEIKVWIGKAVYSSDGQNIGEVEAFKRGSDGSVAELHAGIGGFLGIGETHVVLLPSQFNLAGDRVTLNVAAAAAKDLPKVMK